MKAFYTYLDKEKTVRRWSHSPNLLGSNKENQMLILTEPLKTPNSEEMQAYTKYMEAGHVILLLKKNPKDFFHLGTTAIQTGNTSKNVTTVTSSTGQSYQAKISSPFRLKAKKEDKILLSDQEGVIALKRAFGKGELIVSTAPEWIMNENITDYDHTNLLLSLFNEGNPDTIMFHQYIQGGENTVTWIGLYPKWFLVFMLQGIIIVALLLWQNGKRFGPIYLPREETVRFSDEKIRALAFWYTRSKSYHESLKIQSQYVRMLMQEKWGIPFNTQWLDLSERLLQKWKKLPHKDIHAFIKGLTIILTAEKITKQEYLHWSKKLDYLRKEVEKQ